MDKQDKAHCVNMALHCTFIFTGFQMKKDLSHILAHNINYECSFEPLLEIALKVSQSILRCGDGLIHGRVNMMRLLMCLMGMFSIIKFHISFLQYTTKYKYGILVIDTILISTTTLNKQRRHTCTPGSDCVLVGFPVDES